MTIHPAELIERKRDGGELSDDELRELVLGYARGDVPDYQMAAFCMAVMFRGLTGAETLAMTDAFIGSGETVDMAKQLGRRVVDKHSTGGVGDKTSLILAPLAAACGVFVPMMSGRGLGHSGGTLDKLESIPGFRVGLSLEEMRPILRQVGCVLISPTDAIAPADRALYHLRDVTATVESIPLISASIMSKKIAEGIRALVVDVKCGTGAFMKSRDDAHRLARSLIAIGSANGVRTEALLTVMDFPLGRTAGHALEVRESIEVLKGDGPQDVRELSVQLAARTVL
ncbi:MAG: thymidine phosphorylase, partial [Gaiellaceae bacterium]